MAPGRFGTILNTPGSLWRVGVLALAGSVLRFSSGRAKPRDLPLLLGSLVLLLLDGSRTAFVILFSGGVALVIALVRRSVSRAGGGRPLAIVVGVACLAPMLLVLSAGSGLFFESGEVGLVRRGLTVVQAIVTRNSDDIDRLDSVRSQMNRDVIAAIADHPVLGNGMGTTRSGATSGLVVIHNAYLQMWADVGLLGFLSFSALTLGSIPILCARYRLRAGADPERRVLFYNGMFLLACWGGAALLHPISTELSEWIMFILGYSSVVVAGTAPALRPMPYRAEGRTLLHRGCLA
jgi:O-antigen ligase